MAKTVEFLYDFVSSPSYIAWKSLPPMLAAVGAELVLTPVLLGGIYQATGNAGPLAIPAKSRWYAGDLALWLKKRGVELNPSPFMPFRSLALMRGACVAGLRDETTQYVQAMFDAIYVQGRNLGDLRVVAEALRAAGLDATAYLQGIDREDIKKLLRLSTDDAIARGAFGVPTFFVDRELFFGQDRIEFVMEALQRS